MDQKELNRKLEALFNLQMAILQATPVETTETYVRTRVAAVEAIRVFVGHEDAEQAVDVIINDLRANSDKNGLKGQQLRKIRQLFRGELAEKETDDGNE